MGKRQTTLTDLLQVPAILLLFIFLFHVAGCHSHLNLPQMASPRVGSSKFSLNPLKPFLNLVRDPLRASAQRHRPKMLPLPPGMFHPIPAPSRISTSMSAVPPLRLLGSANTRLMPPSSITVLPPITASASSLMSALSADRNYRPSLSSLSSLSSISSLPSDLQIKTLRLPTRQRRPTTASNLADSVMRQLLDLPSSDSFPSVLIIEDPELGSSSSSSSTADLLSDTLSSSKSSPTIVMSPSLNSGDLVDSSSDLSLSGNNPDVFVIVSKNPKQRGALFGDEKKSSSSTSSSKLKKYKISSSIDEFGNPSSRHVWIIKK